MRSFSILLLAALPGATLAASVPGGLELAPITVTATRTPRPADAVPGAVSVIDADAIEGRQAGSLDDLLQDLPGVATAGGPRGLGETPVIRGLDDSRILITLDGVRQNFRSGHKGVFFIDPELLKTVEVYRGPNSALYGSGALAGQIALTTRDAADLLAPGQAAGGRLKAGWESAAAGWSVGAAAYGRPAADLDLLAWHSRRDGDDLRLGGGETLARSAERSANTLVKLAWAPAGQRLDFTVLDFRQAARVPSNPAADSAIIVDRDTDQRSYRLGYRLSAPQQPWLDLSVLAYRNELDIAEDRLDRPRLDALRFETTGFDIHNHSALGPAQVLSYGLEAYRDRQRGRRNGSVFPEFPDAEAGLLGVYLQDQIQLGDWSLVPGLRYDRYRLEAERDAAANRESRLTPRLGVTWRARDGLSFYGAYAQGFRAPALSELFVSGSHFPGNSFVPNPDLKPERADNAELGVRWRGDNLLREGDSLRAELAVFSMEVEDFIEQQVDFRAGTTTVFNVADAELWGLEAELGYRGPHLELGLGLTRVRGEDSADGRPLASLNPDSLVLRAGYRLPGTGLRLGWRGRFVRAMERVPEGMPATPGYGVNDLLLGWQPGAGLEGLRLELAVYNLADKRYRHHLSAIPETGRDVRLSLSYEF